MSAYVRPRCDFADCARGADVRDEGGAWCALHSAEGFETIAEPCGGCFGAFHPSRLDRDDLCSTCAREAREGGYL